ncbi:MAG: hypothetical protein RIS64_3602 [Bacteroidota bacterium]|jgi:hypothetical protein
MFSTVIPKQEKVRRACIKRDGERIHINQTRNHNETVLILTRKTMFGSHSVLFLNRLQITKDIYALSGIHLYKYK